MSLIKTTTVSKSRLLIVIPRLLQQTVVDLAHMSNHSTVKTKALLREKFGFNNIDSLVEDAVKIVSQMDIATPTFNSEPLRMSQLPRDKNRPPFNG